MQSLILLSYLGNEIDKLKGIQGRNGVAYFSMTNFSLLFTADFQANPTDISFKN
jgi:hypothetical protein